MPLNYISPEGRLSIFTESRGCDLYGVEKSLGFFNAWGKRCVRLKF